MNHKKLSILFAYMSASYIALILFFAWPATVNGEPMQNLLKNSPSPYLAIHGDDPVAWQEWNSATLEMARKQNKLLFVSIGYFSCHWCHVMQAESYKNADIAAFINQNFIPVKYGARSTVVQTTCANGIKFVG